MLPVVQSFNNQSHSLINDYYESNSIEYSNPYFVVKVENWTKNSLSISIKSLLVTQDSTISPSQSPFTFFLLLINEYSKDGEITYETICHNPITRSLHNVWDASKEHRIDFYWATNNGYIYPCTYYTWKEVVPALLENRKA